MNMNDERRNTIALLLSRYPEDAEAEREKARAEYESMTDEELGCALGTFQYEAERDFNADRMDILEERGEK